MMMTDIDTAVEGYNKETSNNNLVSNVVSSVLLVASKASNSMDPRLQEAGNTLQKLIGQIDSPTSNQLQSFLVLANKVAVEGNTIEPTEGYDEAYQLVIDTSLEYNNLGNDDELANKIKEEIQAEQSSDYTGQVMPELVTNPTTGNKFYREGDKLIPEDKYGEHITGTSDEEFVAANGEVPEVSMYDGLADK